ncbi:T9SS type A sorting domain-containing protein [Roseivirga sp. E12]|uniref:T9SS type A sorting domain-containing protein n=1 Tax=Roseivirga sp. E12 TaxID=2819237 RepID=UPI001ABC931B|nr:T9SS type A sorting domain-containing protein [Roseivirga sp. E12]MBO3700751.1 T9SS type A sorting domain-containing protein [Roseivirga sp. E12]
MKSGFRLLLFLFVTLTIVFYVFKPKPIDERLAYERFLKQEYQLFAGRIDTSDLEDGERPDQPDHAYFLNHLQTLDPALQRVPLKRLEEARNQIDILGDRSGITRFSKAEAQNDLVWNNTPSNLAGRVRPITIDPDRSSTGPTKLWAGSVTGGLWVNNNAGDASSSWENVQGLPENASISAIAFDPNNSDIMYVGTGESYTAVNIYRESSSVGNGIWKSEDHGETWTQLTSTSGFQYVNDIVIKSEGDNSVLYTAVVSGVYKGAAFLSNPSDGLFRSVDGGSTWAQVLPNIPNTDKPYAPSDIELDAIGRLFVGTMRNSDLEGAGVVLYSDNGQDWTVYDEVANTQFDPASQYYPGRVIIKSAPTDPNRVYAIISGGRMEARTGWVRDVGPQSFLYQSFDQGATWSRLELPDDQGDTWSNITWHAADLAINPLDPNTIIIGALNGFIMENTNSIPLRTWTNISRWNAFGSSQFVHADNHTIMYDPMKPDTMFISTDGGVFYSNNIQSSQRGFIEVNKDFNTIQYYTLAISGAANDQYLIAGTQDNSTIRLEDSNLGFYPGSGGDGAYCFIDQDEPDLLMYSSQYNGFRVVWNRNVPLNASNITGRNSGLFINPADYDWRTNTLFTNRVGIDIVNNNNNSTTPILRARLTNQTVQEQSLNIGVEINSPISNIKVSPYAQSGQSNLFLGTQSGRVYKVINAQGTPSTQEITGVDFPTSNISSIDVGGSEDELLVTFSNYGVNSVWYTDDGGTTWQSIEGNLPDMPIRWGIFNPLEKRQIYLATELGIWFLDRTEGDNLIWEQEQVGIENVRVDMIKIRQSDGWMVAATHGRGIFETQLNVDDFVTSTPELPSLEVETFPNPTSNELNIRLNANWSGETNISLTNLDGREFERLSFPESTLRMDVSQLPRGIYLLKLWSEGYRSVTKRILVQ